MTKLEKTLYDLLKPLVDDLDNFSIVEDRDKNPREIHLNVFALNNDIARLIGRRGSMATSIRQMMMIASRLENKKVMINFESKKDA